MKKMLTNIINTEQDRDIVKKAVNILRQGAIVAFPTETVYGIGCDFSNDESIRQIFEIKNRPFDKPLAAHIGDFEQIAMLSDEIPEMFYKLAEKFLPGALSVIIRKKNGVSKLMTAGLDTVAIRFPDNPITISLIREFGRPLAATSANISGEIAAINAEQVYSGLAGKIPLIIDDGETVNKNESTVISLVGKPKILRKGSIPQEDIETVLGIKVID